MANNNENTTYINVTNVSKVVKEELESISKHTGIPMASLIKPKLRELVNSYPPEFRVPPIKEK